MSVVPGAGLGMNSSLGSGAGGMGGNSRMMIQGGGVGGGMGGGVGGGVGSGVGGNVQGMQPQQQQPGSVQGKSS